MCTQSENLKLINNHEGSAQRVILKVKSLVEFSTESFHFITVILKNTTVEVTFKPSDLELNFAGSIEVFYFNTVTDYTVECDPAKHTWQWFVPE